MQRILFFLKCRFFALGLRPGLALAVPLLAAGVSLAPPVLAGPVVAQEAKETSAPAPRLGASGYPLPRFASLGSRKINMRSGPGSNYPILWVYSLPGLPIEIIDEFETWRRVRDWQGSTGWIHQNLLSGKRAALITGGLRKLRRKPSEAAAGVALLDQGVLGKLKGCQGPWCRIAVEDHEGWLKRDEFFGTYPDEKIP